jgi:predicted P-loop ATPase
MDPWDKDVSASDVPIVNGAKPHPFDDAAVEFLAKLRPGGPWVLSAIEPDGPIETITAKTDGDVRAFVAKYNGKRNLFYSVNPTRTTLTKKAAKTDIAAIEYLPGDLDPKDGETAEAAKARYLAALDTLKPTPSAVIDSGNGIQVLHKLAERIELAEPVTDEQGKKVFPAETAKLIADVENRVKALMKKLGSAAGTQNIDRILRLPGTVNLPNKKKLAAGRTACPTELLHFNGATCKLEDLPASSSGGNSSSRNTVAIDWAKVEQHGGWLKSADDLPDKFSPKGRMIVAHSGTLEDLKWELNRAKLVGKPYESWSEVALALTAIFKADGRFSNEQIAAALLCKLECNRHVAKLSDEKAKRRAIERMIALVSEPTQKRNAGALKWREQRHGWPLPSMHNARLAITAIGVECSYDTFHNKLLFGVKDDKVRHVVQPILGEVSDDGILALRQLLSDRFGFDLTDRYTRDAVKSLALEHCFDPVADMLEMAEANWDGIARLDRMAADYFNCEDTPLNSACVRKTMIAAVARVRRPGCKFDTITVLESPEGYNKSSAWEVLAGEENFSDEKIMGKESREVQEQLATVWIHENADLAGMRKAEVETVKTFASRTVDRARPAYGHFQKNQPRHSIETGTTNSDEYLQSQTGNRRFWGMRVLRAIDLEKLKADRLQLWGEAAHYQRKGESLTLDESMWGVAGVEQEARRVKDPWEAVLADMPEGIETKEWIAEEKRYVSNYHQIIHYVDDYYGAYFGVQERVASSDLLTHVLAIPVGQQTTAHTMRLANVMRLLKWNRTSNGKITINGKQVRGYFRWPSTEEPS